MLVCHNASATSSRAIDRYVVVHQCIINSRSCRPNVSSIFDGSGVVDGDGSASSLLGWADLGMRSVMVGGRDSEEKEEALETDEAERDLSRRVRRGRGRYWLTILRSTQCGQLGSEYYRESADRYERGGDHWMQELRCSSGGPRGGNRKGKETNPAFSLQSSLSWSLILPGHHRRETPRGQSGLFWISLRGSIENLWEEEDVKPKKNKT